MKRNKYGRIVNVSSGAGSLHYIGVGTPPAYSVSKAALNAFTQILAAELLGTLCEEKRRVEYNVYGDQEEEENGSMT